MSARTKLCSSATCDDAEVRHERRERVVGDLGPRARDGADEGALADVGEAEQPHVGHDLELEAEVLLLARLARIGAARCAIERRREVDVAATSAPSAGDDDALARRRRRRRAARSSPTSYPCVPTGTRTTRSSPPLPYWSLPRPCSPRSACERARQRNVEQRRLALVADEDDVASLAAVAARRAAEGDVLLAAERDAAVAAGAGHDLHLARVDELHRRRV